MRRVILLISLALAVLGCTGEEPVQPKEHELTPEEQVKQHLDDTFSEFVVALDPATMEWTEDYILTHSTLDLELDGTFVYRFIRDNTILVTVRLNLIRGDWRVEAKLHGGLEVKGYVKPTLSVDWTEWENNWDLDVYDQGTAVAKLGVEAFSRQNAGEVELQLVPVFRFPDGTSYSVTTLVLIEPLIDYLLENVLSTS